MTQTGFVPVKTQAFVHVVIQTYAPMHKTEIAIKKRAKKELREGNKEGREKKV